MEDTQLIAKIRDSFHHHHHHHQHFKHGLDNKIIFLSPRRYGWQIGLANKSNNKVRIKALNQKCLEALSGNRARRCRCDTSFRKGKMIFMMMMMMMRDSNDSHYITAFSHSLGSLFSIIISAGWRKNRKLATVN